MQSLLIVVMRPRDDQMFLINMLMYKHGFQYDGDDYVILRAPMDGPF